MPLRSTTHATSDQNESTSHLHHGTRVHSTLCTKREAISLLGEFPIKDGLITAYDPFCGDRLVGHTELNSKADAR